MIISYQGKSPIIAPGSFVAPNAIIIGDVTLADETSVWFGVVLRGDINSITIGEFTNIQDNSVVHVGHDVPTIIGNHVTVGHGAIIHGCTIGSGCLIGMGAIILDQAVIGEGSLIAAGSVVKQGRIVPANSLVAGSPGMVKRQISVEERQFFKEWAIRYRGYAKGYH